MKQPHAPESEQAIVAALLLRPDTADELVGIVSPDDFHDMRLRAVYLAIARLFDRGEPVDIPRLEVQLRAQDQLNLVGGIEGIGRITDAYRYLPQHLEHHAELVRRLAEVRRVVEACAEIAEEGGEALEDPAAWLDRASARMSRLQARGRGGYVHLRDAVGDVVRDIFARKDRPFIGVPTPFEDVNELLLGLEPADLIILGARPSVGKTALGLQLLTHAAQLGIPGIVISIEMKARRLIERKLASEGKIHASRLRSGRLIGGDAAALVSAAERIAKLPIVIDDVTKKVTEIRARARAWRRDRSVEHRKDGLGLVMVDYLQLAEGGADDYDIREREVSEISAGLKSLAKELDVPVLALCQMNRGIESKPREPELSDLRESGAIEQDADVVLFLWRDNPKDKDSRGLKVGKQRNGPCDTVRLRFVPQHQVFEQAKENRQTEMPT